MTTPSPRIPHYEPLEARRARHRRTGFIIGAIAAALVILVSSVVIAINMIDDPHDTGPQNRAEAESAPQPGTGDHRVQIWGSTWCAAPGPEPGNPDRTVMVLTECTDDIEPIQVEQLEEGRYRLGIEFSDDDWRACLSIDPPADEDGYLLGPYPCDEAEFGEFAATPHPEGGFNLTLPNDLCLGVLESTIAQGAPLSAWTCQPDTLSQRFEFLPL